MDANKSGDCTAMYLVAFCLGCLGLFSVMLADEFYWNYGILAELDPDFSIPYLLRSAAIFLSTLLIVRAMTANNRPQIALLDESRKRFQIAGILTTLTVSTAFLFLFFFAAEKFNLLAIEDSAVEWSSALLLFACCLVLVYAALKSHVLPDSSSLATAALALLAILFFIIGMEEVSWFQRVLDIKTPDAFVNNVQDEMNFHNFATNHTENMYYLGAFVFLVMLPFVRVFFPFVSDIKFLALIIGRPSIAVSGAVACAYNFDMWNIIFSQVAFFGCLSVLLVFFIFCGNWLDRSILFITVALLITTQLVFLLNGSNFSKESNVTEYRELMIPLAFFVYCLDVLLQLVSPSPAAHRTTQTAG